MTSHDTNTCLLLPLMTYTNSGPTHPLEVSVMVIPFLEALKLTMFRLSIPSALSCLRAFPTSASLPAPGTSTAPSDTKSHAGEGEGGGGGRGGGRKRQKMVEEEERKEEEVKRGRGRKWRKKKRRTRRWKK